MSEHIEVFIEKLVYGGNGLGRLNTGQTVFVPGVLPGESVLVKIKRRRKGFLEAELVRLLSTSPYRITPPCRGDKECTGATWPYISYPAQLRFKEEILNDVLKRIAGLDAEHFLPIIPSPKTEHYRLRTQFNVDMKSGRPRIGFFKQGSHQLVEVENALLLHPLIDRVLSALRSQEHILPELSEIHINVSPGGEAHLLFFGGERLRRDSNINTLFERLRSIVPEVIGITCYANKQKFFAAGRDHLILEIDGIRLRATEGNFYQVNWEQNMNMVKTVTSFAGLKGGEIVLDLYCGIGNFALPLARTAEMVIGIEAGYSSVEDAKFNAAQNGLTNTSFIADDLQKGLKTLLQRKVKADVIVLDPPRAGATLKSLERILAFVPKKIIYVSCNPTTLARDIKYFALFGFRLKRLQPVDMFPYTYHIECVAEMEREG